MSYIGQNYSVIVHWWNYLSMCYYRKVLLNYLRGAAGMAGTLTGELGWGTLFVPGTALFHEYYHKKSDIAVWPILICFTLHTLLFGLSDSEGNLRGIRQWAEGKTFSGQVKVLTLITSLKLGSNADLDFHKITLPLLTPGPELNILSSMSAMHVSPQVSSCFLRRYQGGWSLTKSPDMRWGGRGWGDEAESAAWIVVSSRNSMKNVAVLWCEFRYFNEKAVFSS